VTGGQRDELVAARADAILARARTAEAYAEHFEAQMDRGKLRKLLSSARVFRRPGALLLAVILVPCGLLGYAASKADTAQVLSGTNELAAVNTASGQLVAVTPLPDPPGGLSAADGSVWVADPAAGRVSRIDPGTGAEAAWVPVDGEPGAIASGGGAIWVAGTEGGTVTRIDPVTDGVTQTISLPWTHPEDITFGAGRVWVADPAARELAEINPVTGSLERELPLDLQPSAIAAVGQAIWIAGYDTATIEKLAAASGRVLARVRVANGPAALAVGDGSLWVASSAGAVSRIDLATSAVAAVIPVGGSPAALVAGPGSVWIASLDSGTISQIDPRTNRVTASVSVTGVPTSLAIAGSLIWTGIQRTGEAVRSVTDWRLPGPSRLPGEQAEGAGLVDGLGPAAGAELGVQVPLVRLDRVHRQVQLAGDLPCRQVGRQVMQHPGLAAGQHLAMASRGGQGAAGVGWVAERVAGDRRQQERRRHPDPLSGRDVGLIDRCGHLTAPSCLSRVRYFYVRAPGGPIAPVTGPGQGPGLGPTHPSVRLGRLVSGSDSGVGRPAGGEIPLVGARLYISEPCPHIQREAPSAKDLTCQTATTRTPRPSPG
jgi:YVTN family beta-propeller protein